MKNRSNLKATYIMTILHNYNNIVIMDLTLDELRDVAEFINILSNERKIHLMYEAFERSADNYEKLCAWNEREPQEITEEDCDDEFNCVKWHLQDMAEEACGKPWRFLAK